MQDWVEKCDAFLQFSEYEILTNAGNMSHEVAEKLALEEFEKYKPIQDKNYISDFDHEVLDNAGTELEDFDKEIEEYLPQNK